MSDQDQQPPAYPPPGQPGEPPAYPQPPAMPPEYAPPAQPPMVPPSYPPTPNPQPGEPPAYPPAPPVGPQPQGYPPQQPPTQPSGYPGQPPAPAQPQWYGPGPAEPMVQPPAKKGKGGIVAVVIALVVICGLVGCGALALTLFKSGGSASTASIKQAETHFDATVAAVETANKSLESLSTGKASASDTKKIVSEADDALRKARDEVAAARTIADTWKDSQGKTDYLEGLSAATLTLDLLQDFVAYVDTASGMLGKAKQGGKEAKSGNDALNAAIRAGNSSSWSKMRTKAQSAQTHYVKAALLFREAHKLDKSAGLDKAAKYADLRKKQADVVARMASEGSARRFTAYNADVKKMNSLGKSAEKVGTPAIVSDKNWAENRLDDLETAITEASEKSDELRKRALEELGYTK